MPPAFFSEVPEPIRYGGPSSTDPLSFRVYQPDRIVAGKRMEDHLRIAVCLWHSFNWPGSDVFGTGTFDRPWLAPNADPMEAAAAKVDAAFEFIGKLGAPFFTFHDRDIAPEASTFAESASHLDAMVARAEEGMARTGARLLWGTANLFSHPRYAAGAATNPDPEVFAYAAGQVKLMLEATKRLVGTVVVILNTTLLFTPIPLSNVVPALLIALISLAYLEEDGLLLSIALLVASIVLTVELVAVWQMVRGAKWIVGLW